MDPDEQEEGEELAPERRTVRDELRHVFGGSHLLMKDLGAGTVALVVHWWLWLMKSETREELGERAGATALVSAIVGWEAWHFPAVGEPLLGAAWFIAAAWCAPRRTEKRAKSTRAVGEEASVAKEEVPAATETGVVVSLLERVEQELADVAQRGGRGVRVEDLRALLESEGAIPPSTAADFKDLLRAEGVPVRDQMYFKIDGRKVNHPGVHVEDLARALGRRPRLPPHLVPDLTPAPDTEAPPGGPPGVPAAGHAS